MSLNIKDPEAHHLAQAIARATGQTMTRVVTEALRRGMNSSSSETAGRRSTNCWPSPTGLQLISAALTSTTRCFYTAMTVCRNDR